MIYYRGSNDSPERIQTGNAWWDSQLFVTESPQKASFYGSNIDAIEVDSSANILREGTADFVRVAGRWRKGESLLDFAVRSAQAALEAGYDVVEFKRQGDVGTVILNPDVVVSRYRLLKNQPEASCWVRKICRFANY